MFTRGMPRRGRNIRRQAFGRQEYKKDIRGARDQVLIRGKTDIVRRTEEGLGGEKAAERVHAS